ncbi:MAG TPA: M28 family peptidase [Thermomicrobiaceae bacterium]|nr:M28 family peptidase [Thermomicrobiaceae bacterium]
MDFNDVATLAGRIGPRPAGSPPEQQAATYVAERLQHLDIPSATLPVAIPRAFSLAYLTLFAVAALSVAAAWFSPVLGLILCLIAIGLLVAEGTAHPTVSRLLASRPSQSVVGLIPALADEGEEVADPPRRVILTAHLDSGRAGLLTRPFLIRRFRALTLAMLGSVVLIAVLQIAQLAARSRVPWYVSLVPLVVLLAGVALLVEREARGGAVAGANDDASGVAAVLGVAATLQRDRPVHVETWTLFTSGEEAGMAGLRQFLAENRFDPNRTYFVNVDSVGAGGIRYTRGEGLAMLLRSSPILTRMANEIARNHPEWAVRSQAHQLLPTDQYVALSQGYQAIGVFAVDASGHVPNWHQPTDTVEHIDVRTVTIAADFVLALVRRLDSEAGEAMARLPIDALADPLAP